MNYGKSPYATVTVCGGLGDFPMKTAMFGWAIPSL